MRQFSFVFLLTWTTLISFAIGSQAATVTEIFKEKSLVKLSEGSATGFTKGARVCFDNASNKRVLCARITSTTDTNATVKVKSISKISVGMTANLRPNSTSSTSKTQSSASAKNQPNIKLGAIFSALTPATYNRITYNPPPATGAITAQPSLWKQEQSATSSFIGAFGESEFGIGRTISMAIGLRYRQYSGFEASTDYSQNFSEYVEVTQEASALGLYGDVNFFKMALGTSAFLKFGSGLDVDMSTVTFKALQKSDAGASNDIASYKSNLNLISLRLNSSFAFQIGHLGFITPGINLLVPLVAAGGSTSAKVEDPQADTLLEGGLAAAEEDLKKAVDHKKASFGAEVYLAAFIAF